MNGVFFPMLIQGLAGANRRMYDGGATYAHNQELLYLNVVMSVSAWALGLFQLPFILNFFKHMFKGDKVDSNPWHATTLDWVATSSPPMGHGNFATIPVVYRGPYEYSVPGHSSDFTPQNQKA
jgi:cytochrome c oxidase subunit 1